MAKPRTQDPDRIDDLPDQLRDRPDSGGPTSPGDEGAGGTEPQPLKTAVGTMDRDVPAGPGDAGAADRPERNATPLDSRTSSTQRLATGLAAAAVIAVVVLLLIAIF